MSSGRTKLERSLAIDRAGGNGRRTSAGRLVVGLRRPLSALSFWTAIALPALYLPLLFHGIGSVDQLALFLGLLGLHVLALTGGRRHRIGR